MQRYHLERPEVGAIAPDPADEMQQILFQLGQEHEQRYLKTLQQSGADLYQVEHKDAWESILEAMQSGRSYIYQAVLQQDNWMGRADF